MSEVIDHGSCIEECWFVVKPLICWTVELSCWCGSIDQNSTVNWCFHGQLWWSCLQIPEAPSIRFLAFCVRYCRQPVPTGCWTLSFVFPAAWQNQGDWDYLSLIKCILHRLLNWISCFLQLVERTKETFFLMRITYHYYSKYFIDCTAKIRETKSKRGWEWPTF